MTKADDIQEDIKNHISELVAVVRAMGGSAGKYRREKAEHNQSHCCGGVLSAQSYPGD